MRISDWSSDVCSSDLDCGLTYLHVFPYSARKGTPAARMPQLPVALRKARAARLRAAGERALSRFLDGQIGRTTAVLIEKQEADGRLLGRSDTFRSEEHTYDIQSLMRISYAFFC